MSTLDFELTLLGLCLFVCYLLYQLCVCSFSLKISSHSMAVKAGKMIKRITSKSDAWCCMPTISSVYSFQPLVIYHIEIIDWWYDFITHQQCKNNNNNNRVVGWWWITEQLNQCLFVCFLSCSANAAAAAGGILLLLLYLPYYFVNPRYDLLSWSEKMAACLDLNVAMAFGWIQLAEFEETGMGWCLFTRNRHLSLIYLLLFTFDRQ